MRDLIAIVSANIKRMREAAGLSQEDLAHEAGLDRTYVGSVERGERNVSLKNIERIAKALKIAPHVLLVAATKDT